MGGERADECEERNVAGDGKTRDERERKKERRRMRDGREKRQKNLPYLTSISTTHRRKTPAAHHRGH